MNITVEAISAKGAVKADGVWYSPSKFAKGLPKFEVGKMYDITVKVNGVFNNINAATEITSVDEQPRIPVDKEIKSIPSTSKVMVPFGLVNFNTVEKKRDFDAEARGKTRCAIYAAAVTGMAKSVEEAKRIADIGVAYSFGDPTPKEDNAIEFLPEE
jgi:hypothetical protein